MDKNSLLASLREYADAGVIPMHMPGHKRNKDFLLEDLPWSLDITEIDGFDNLHMPRGILDRCQKQAADLWGSEKAYYLVGGSTSGILAGIYACTHKGGKILMGRNCHKSVYHAVELCGLKPVYITPSKAQFCGVYGSVEPEEVAAAIARDGDIQLAVITSPTYEGIISNIDDIANILHRNGTPLLVDEAHGAHLGWSQRFPGGAVESGADIVIHSLHKTLPSLTQTGIAHIQGGLVSPASMRHALSVFQSSSPSYILMASIDQCVSLMRDSGGELMERWAERLNKFYERTSGLRRLEVIRPEKESVGVFGHDPGKIIISTEKAECTGGEIMDWLLSTESIQLEMSGGEYALAMTGICDTQEAMERLELALYKADSFFSRSEGRRKTLTSVYSAAHQIVPASEAIHMESELIPLGQCKDRISGEYIWAYPPGIPILTPGQAVSNEIIELILDLYKKNVSISSTSDSLPENMEVLKSGFFESRD